MSISQDFCENVEEIAANPSVSKNDSIWLLIAAQNCTNIGGNLALQRRPGALQKIGHFSSRLAYEMIHRQKCQFFKIPPNFWGRPVQPTCLQKLPNLESNRISKLHKSRRGSGSQEPDKRRPNMSRKMGHFSSRLASGMTSCQKCQLLNIPQNFWGNPGQSVCLQKWWNSEGNRGSELPKS